MRTLWFLLTTMVVAVWSMPPAEVINDESLSGTALSARNSLFEGIVLNLLETLRGIIKDGSGIIPPLDPLDIPSLDLDDDIIPLPGAEVSLVNLRVANLATFEVDNLNIRMLTIIRYRLLLDIRIPSLDVSAENYELDVSALGYNLFGVGDLKLNIIDPKVSTNLVLRVTRRDGGTYLNVIECNVKFSLGGFKPQITGLFGHAGASSFVDLFLQDLVPNLVTFYEDEITEFLSTNVMEIANVLLEELEVGSIISP